LEEHHHPKFHLDKQLAIIAKDYQNNHLHPENNHYLNPDSEQPLVSNQEPEQQNLKKDKLLLPEHNLEVY